MKNSIEESMHTSFLYCTFLRCIPSRLLNSPKYRRGNGRRVSKIYNQLWMSRMTLNKISMLYSGCYGLQYGSRFLGILLHVSGTKWHIR